MRQIRNVIFEGHMEKCTEIMGQYFFKFCIILLCTFVCGHFDVQTEGGNLCKICTSVDKQNVHFGSLYNPLHPVVVHLCVYLHVTDK
jgi:hypothetical protein